MDKNDKELDVESEELEEPEEILDEAGNDITDWKALALKKHGIAKRLRTRAIKAKEADEKMAIEKKEIEDKKAKEEAKKGEEKSQDKKEFDMAEKSYLLAKGIKENQFPLVLDEIKASGKSIDEILASKYFQEKLEEFATKEATPKDNKRGGGSAKDKVEYWIQKGEYPPKDQVELRRKVAAALAKKAESGSKFSDNPVI